MLVGAGTVRADDPELTVRSRPAVPQRVEPTLEMTGDPQVCLASSARRELGNRSTCIPSMVNIVDVKAQVSVKAWSKQTVLLSSKSEEIHRRYSRRQR